MIFYKDFVYPKRDGHMIPVEVFAGQVCLYYLISQTRVKAKKVHFQLHLDKLFSCQHPSDFVIFDKQDVPNMGVEPRNN